MAETQKPSIIQFESEDFYRAVAGLILFDLGLEISKTATNLHQAEVVIKQLTEKKINADLAIIDTLLEREHHEGEKLATALKAANPKIKIIAYTILPEDQAWADYTALKSNRDPNRTLIKGFETLLGVSGQGKSVKSGNKAEKASA